MSRARRLLSFAAVITGALASIATSEEIPESVWRGTFGLDGVTLTEGEAHTVQVVMTIDGARDYYTSEIRLTGEVRSGEARVTLSAGDAQESGEGALDLLIAPEWRCEMQRCQASVVVDLEALSGEPEIDSSIDVMVSGVGTSGASDEGAVVFRVADPDPR